MTGGNFHWYRRLNKKPIIKENILATKELEPGMKRKSIAEDKQLSLVHAALKSTSAFVRN